jgi:hypothetical protein
MITYSEVPSINAVIINTPVTPSTLDANGGKILFVFTALVGGTYSLDMTIYGQCGGTLTEITTLLTKNATLQFANPNYNSRTTQPLAPSTPQEITHTHKAKINLITGDTVYFGGYTSSPSFDALFNNGAMIVLKVG